MKKEKKKESIKKGKNKDTNKKKKWAFESWMKMKENTEERKERDIENCERKKKHYFK